MKIKQPGQAKRAELLKKQLFVFYFDFGFWPAIALLEIAKRDIEESQRQVDKEIEKVEEQIRQTGKLKLLVANKRKT